MFTLKDGIYFYRWAQGQGTNGLPSIIYLHKNSGGKGINFILQIWFFSKIQPPQNKQKPKSSTNSTWNLIFAKSTEASRWWSQMQQWTSVRQMVIFLNQGNSTNDAIDSPMLDSWGRATWWQGDGHRKRAMKDNASHPHIGSLRLLVSSWR